MIVRIKTNRNRKIKYLRDVLKLSYTKISKRFNISSERVRQICSKTEDKKKIFDQIKEQYLEKFNDKLTYNDLIEDIKLFSIHDRKKQTVAKRRILVAFLHEELNLPFYKIGILLDRNHTTITHLYWNDND